MLDITKLRNEFNDLHANVEAMITKASDEKRDFTADENTEKTNSFARMEQIKQTIAEQEKLAGVAFTDKTNNVELPADVPGKAEKEAVEIHVGQTYGGTKREAFARAFNEWAVTGNMPRQFATITTASASSMLMPVGVDFPIVATAPNTIREALAIHKQQPMQTPSTRTINVPVADASSGSKVTIGTDDSTSEESENEPTLTDTITLPAYTYQSGSVWFENKELMAVDFDLMAATMPALQYSKELAVESDIFAKIIADGGVTNSVATSSTSAITYANLVSLNRKLAKRYNALKVIILGTACYTAAENLTTTTGYPVLNALDPQNASLKFFNGTPVLYSDYLEAFGANKVVGCIISLVGFRLRDCGQEQVQRYTQYPRRPGQSGFNLYGWHGYGYATAAVSKLKCPAS